VIRLERAARLNGLVYWFDLLLCDGVRVSNRPGELPGSWGQVFLPVDPPLEVRQGEALRVQVRAQAVPDGAPGWLVWEVAGEQGQRCGHEFAGAPLGLGDLRAGSRDSVPELSAAGRLAVEILGLVDGRRTLDEIAGLLAKQEDKPLPELEELVTRELRGRITVSAESRSGGLKP